MPSVGFLHIDAAVGHGAVADLADVAVAVDDLGQAVVRAVGIGDIQRPALRFAFDAVGVAVPEDFGGGAGVSDGMPSACATIAPCKALFPTPTFAVAVI